MSFIRKETELVQRAQEALSNGTLHSLGRAELLELQRALQIELTPSPRMHATLRAVESRLAFLDAEDAETRAVERYNSQTKVATRSLHWAKVAGVAAVASVVLANVAMILSWFFWRYPKAPAAPTPTEQGVGRG